MKASHAAAVAAVGDNCDSGQCGEFPGDAALLPVIGAGLVVLAGLAPGRVGLDRLLASRPLTYIGDRSYSFYLWHFPVLILVWQAAGHVLPAGVNLALLVGAFLLSDLTFDFYENPLRFARWLRGWRTAAMAAVSMSAAVLAVLITLSAFQATLAEEAAAAQRAHVAGLAPARGQPDPKSLWASRPIPAVSAAVRFTNLPVNHFSAIGSIHRLPGIFCCAA